jgi:MFS family permease
MQVYKMSKPEAGRILSMLAIGMVIGSPLLSYLSNNLFRGRKPVIVISSAVVLVITYFMAFHTEGISVFWHYTLCLGLGIFSSAIVVIGFTATKELFPVQMAGTAIGLVNLFPFAGGAVFQPVLGYILESNGRIEGAFTLAGYRSAFLVLFMCGIIAFLSSFFVRETMSKK